MVGLREPSEEEIARPGLISCIFNAAANTEKMSRTGRAEKELSDEPVAEPAKTRAAQAVRNASN